MPLLDGLFYSPSTEPFFSDAACVQSMLDFEAALANAEAKAGLIPSSASAAITANCRAELFDLNALVASAPQSANLAIPLIKQLTALVARQNAEAARFVHWGATSQDVIDTGLILQMRNALDPILSDLDSLCDALAKLANAHRNTPIVARTLLQQALPTSFGFIVAGWLDALLRHRYRLLALKSNSLVLQFGGAVGTLAALGTNGPVVARHLSEELSLPLPTAPWHSHRDRIAEIAASFGILSGSLAKIAHDLSLHMQTEIAELAEPSAPGRGGSSTMPHKQNPVACAAILAATARVPGLISTILSAMPQDHQRGLGNWHAEAPTLTEILRLSSGALHRLAVLAPNLQISTAQMRENLELTHGLIYAEAVSFALAEKLGRAAAHEKIEAACAVAIQSRRHLREVLSSQPEISANLSSSDFDSFFNPLNYLGSSSSFIDAILAENNSRKNPTQPAAKG
ncbi:MAG: 3-carboxy-cis,cis-muconate cycloisomerase [Acidobacteria bacterium]|nr:3-carboxy-cis,cis-muconate cycloisomerase [Acidobacteriota bacterium]MBS1865961.1 3-carboxy-cis,cis-muconate cycloisomerase [Acidobacteriota bacterium]